jgi:hypothetical protein
VYKVSLCVVFLIPLLPRACKGQITLTIAWQLTKDTFVLKSSERINDLKNIAPVMHRGGDPIARGT